MQNSAASEKNKNKFIKFLPLFYSPYFTFPYKIRNTITTVKKRNIIDPYWYVKLQDIFAFSSRHDDENKKLLFVCQINLNEKLILKARVSRTRSFVLHMLNYAQLILISADWNVPSIWCFIIFHTQRTAFQKCKL